MTHWPNSLRATALGQPQEGKRRHLVLCLSRAMNSYMGSASDLCECKSLTSALLSFGAKNTFKGNRACSSSTLRASAPATWEETRYLDRVVISKEQRGSPASHSVQALDPLRQTALPIKVIVVSTPREKCGCHPHQNKPSQQRHWIHTVYMGILPHKNTLSRPQ